MRIRRCLMLRPGAIGDSIVTLPAMEALRAEYTEVWAPQHNLPLFRFADVRHSLASTGMDSFGLPEREPPPTLLERLRSFDVVYSWYGTNRPEFRDAVAALALPFRFFPALPPHPAPQHAVDFFLEQAGFPARAGAMPTLGLSHRPQVEDGFIVIHPFSASARKNWPLDRFQELASRLPLPVRWCAGPEDPLPGAVRFADLYELAEWLTGATLYIGNDSGIAHLAAAAGVPVVAIFTLMDPRVWAPRGPQVEVVEGSDSNAITVAHVDQTVRGLLRRVLNS